MSHFFIDRPIFAWVIAIMIMVAGAMALFRLPVEQYPQVAPPSITITATYPGASAKTVEDTVTQIIEQKMNGLDYLRYIESSSDSSGTASVVITFNGGANADIAQVQVQNKLQSAIPLLPQEVQALGVQVSKSSSSMLLVVGLVSDDGRMSSEDLSDFVFGTLQDPVSRVAGVGSIQAFGSQYAMRIWLHPDKLMQYKLTSADVSAAITAQNSQVSSGNLGALPAVPGQRLDATITTRGRLETPAQFGDILLRTNPDGSRVYLRDVARIELGSENYNIVSRFNGGPAAGFVINPAAGANALETVAAVKAKLAEMQPFFPKGLRLVYPFDTTPFVKHSITDVIKTLIEAVVLVFLVMYLFLGNLRATIIPTITVPVVLLGTFGVLAVLGYSVNTLTLFGLVLAIGLLVDDAIVVVENVERLMEEEGLSPREAARKSMTQITGALVGIGLVLCAAFLPMAFMGNSIGVIYRQFAVTMSTAIALSVVVALILTPALCATMLKPVKKGELHEQKGFFGWFNRMFSRTTNRYVGVVDFVLRRRALLFVGYAGICIAVIMMFRQLPTGFLPEEDTGTVMAMAMLPAGATIEQSEAVLKKMENEFLVNMKDSVKSVFSVAGFSFAGVGQNQAALFVELKDWSERKGPGQSAKEIQGRAMGTFMQMKEAMAFAMIPPAVQELGNTSGFDFRLIDTGGLGHEAMTKAQFQLLGLAAQNPALQGVRPNSMSDKADLWLDIDYQKAQTLGVSVADINRELANIFGSSYINDFIDKGRVKKVYMQGDAPFRMSPEDLSKWYLRNSKGEMVPFAGIINSRWV
ncbi:MAG: efflux RND transporter permease subunit, partial [Candidatus Methylacidiphilales bacterium]